MFHYNGCLNLEFFYENKDNQLTKKIALKHAMWFGYLLSFNTHS